MTETQALKPDFRIYKLDTTEYWREDIRRQVGKIFQVYIFDANRHTYCCEITPSFEMWLLGPTWTNSQDSEADRERSHEQIMEGSAETDNVMYVHVRNVDLTKCEARTMTDEEWAKLVEEHDGNADTAWEEALVNVSEYLRCNGWVY